METNELEKQFNAAILDVYNQLPITARERAQRHLLQKIKFLQEANHSVLVQQIIGASWLAFRENYSDLWYPRSVFLSEVNVAAVSMYAIDLLRYCWLFGEVDLGDMRSVKRCAARILNPAIAPSSYWGMLKNPQYTTDYCTGIMRDLEQMRINYAHNKIWYFRIMR